MRLRTIPAVLVLAAGLGTSPAWAAFHLMNVVEVFPGAVSAPDAQYVVLQMWSGGQNFVAGHPVYFYDASGALVGTVTFPGNVANAADQDKILIATTQAQTFFGGLAADLVMTSGSIRVTGGKVCFDTIDCVAWGNYAPADASVGTPAQRPVGLTLGRALKRDISAGNPTLLEFTDDTNDSAADFDLAAPNPRNNARQAGIPPVSVCQNTILEGLEDCDDGNAIPDDTCNAICSLTRVFADGAETGDLSRWHVAATDGGDLSASAAAAQNATTAGVQGVVDDVAGIYVQNDSPSDENRYRARFYFDPNGFDPGEASGARRTRIFIAFEEAPNRRLLAVVLRRVNGQYGVMGRTRRDDNSQADTGFFDITDDPHWVEIDWRRSSGANDGSFRLWIDGVLRSTLSGLDNDVSGVDFVRLGALSVKPTAGGTMYWDELDSRRETFIGP